MAGSRTYRTKVLVLDKTKLKETDLILTMLDERAQLPDFLMHKLQPFILL